MIPPLSPEVRNQAGSNFIVFGLPMHALHSAWYFSFSITLYIISSEDHDVYKAYWLDMVCWGYWTISLYWNFKRWVTHFIVHTISHAYAACQGIRNRLYEAFAPRLRDRVKKAYRLLIEMARDQSSFGKESRWWRRPALRARSCKRLR
jgi:hypothetical protein